MQLTEFQLRAATSTARNLQIVACAGSGKTEVLAQRVSHVLTGANNTLVPANIVAFTFTNKASYELRRRIVDRVREQSGQPVIGMADMFIGTIHSFCLTPNPPNGVGRALEQDITGMERRPPRRIWDGRGQ